MRPLGDDPPCATSSGGAARVFEGRTLPCSHRRGAAPPLRRRSDLGCAGRVGVPDAHSAAHLATLARPAQHASRVQSARWPMCRVHTARPCTPPQGVDTPQLRRPLRGVCEAIVVRTHHDDRATATPSEAATGARWFPKGGLPRRLLRHGRPSWRDCSVAPGAMGRWCRDRTADTLRLRRRRYAAWSGDNGDGYAAGWCPGGAAKPSDRQTPQRGRFAPVAK